LTELGIIEFVKLYEEEKAVWL